MKCKWEGKHRNKSTGGVVIRPVQMGGEQVVEFCRQILIFMVNTVS